MNRIAKFLVGITKRWGWHSYDRGFEYETWNLWGIVKFYRHVACANCLYVFGAMVYNDDL